jgi:molybdopterin synthase catalytic subunit
MIDTQLLHAPLSAAFCEAFVQSDEAGGMVCFVGTVRNQTQHRNVNHLYFEAYEPMALKELQKIATALIAKFGAIKVSIHHRLGKLAVGETAVIIAVSSPHRKAAFQACEFAIDTLKQTVPIWKKEVFEDGETWVSAHP